MDLRHNRSDHSIASPTSKVQHGRRSLRGASVTGTSRLVVPPSRLSTVANRAFPVVAARTWNDLPADVTSAESIAVYIPPETENTSVSEVISPIFPGF